MKQKIIAVSGVKKSGKTTLLEKLIPALAARGVSSAVVKHDAHRFEIDREGKDSWRFTQAGADVVLLSSPEKTALRLMIEGMTNTSSRSIR